MAFYVKPENGNSGGVAHGGMLMSIADYSLCSAAMESREKYVATISFRSEFMSGAKIGSLLEVHTKISKHTKKKYKLILTGGYSHLFIKSIKQKARLDKDITMKGLLKITKLL